MPAPIDRLPDPQVQLRKRVAALSSSPGAVDKLAARIGLPPDALHAFLRGSHLAGWAAARLEAALDQDAADQSANWRFGAR